MTDEAPLLVMIVSANPLARIGLAALLSTLSGYESCGEFEPQADLAALKAQTGAEVLLWDMGWDGGDSLEALRGLELPPIVALLSDDQDASALLQAGVAGLLWQSSRPDQLAAALRAVREGLSVYDPDFLPSLPNPEATAPTTDLTQREQEVLQLLAQGLANKTIARQLNVSDHTVKFHVNAIMTKLEAQSRTEAVIKAMKLGLVVL